MSNLKGRFFSNFWWLGFSDYLNFDLLSKKISTFHKFLFSNQLCIQNCSVSLVRGNFEGTRENKKYTIQALETSKSMIFWFWRRLSNKHMHFMISLFVYILRFWIDLVEFFTMKLWKFIWWVSNFLFISDSTEMAFPLGISSFEIAL